LQNVILRCDLHRAILQDRLSKCHGSQCGFCTPGFVMSMYSLLAKSATPDQHAIEETIDGNLCRCNPKSSVCATSSMRFASSHLVARAVARSTFLLGLGTGYRPILDAFKTFASDSESYSPLSQPPITIAFPEELRSLARQVGAWQSCFGSASHAGL
jgi:hypothetical protein